MSYILDPSNFKKRTEVDPDSWVNKFRIGNTSYFTKPEGEGLMGKVLNINYQTMWLTAPCVLLHFVAFKKIRYPTPLFYKYCQFAGPWHLGASLFAITSTKVCSWRGKDDNANWFAGGAVAGAVPGMACRNWLIKSNRFWGWTFLVGPLLGGLAAYAMKRNNPQFFLNNYRNYDERYQFNPEQYTREYSQFTLPVERPSIDWLNGGVDGDTPYSWIGEKMSHRRLLLKQEWGYLEAELDQVPAIEKAIRERW